MSKIVVFKGNNSDISKQQASQGIPTQINTNPFPFDFSRGYVSRISNFTGVAAGTNQVLYTVPKDKTFYLFHVNLQICVQKPLGGGAGGYGYICLNNSSGSAIIGLNGGYLGDVGGSEAQSFAPSIPLVMNAGETINIQTFAGTAGTTIWASIFGYELQNLQK